MKKGLFIKLLGIFFIVFGLLAMIQAIIKGEPILILWICYIGMIIIGIGCLVNNREIILSQLNILTIPLFLWDIDFISFLIFNKSIFGLVDYFFKEPSIISRLISLEHLFLIPLGIIAFYLVKNKKVKKNYAWKLSLIELTLIFIILRVINIQDNNLNCAFYSCIPYLNPEPYWLWWFVIIFIVVIITDFIYRYFFYNKNVPQK